MGNMMRSKNKNFESSSLVQCHVIVGPTSNFGKFEMYEYVGSCKVTKKMSNGCEWCCALVNCQLQSWQSFIFIMIVVHNRVQPFDLL